MADRIIKADSGNDVVIQNNGGTRKIEVTNSGDVEVTGDFKSTTVKATNLKANDGTASLEIADSSGDIGFSGNTNLKIKLPSAGGIYESDGSTEILTESSGTVTLKNTTLNSNNTFPTGHIIGVFSDNYTRTSGLDVVSGTLLWDQLDVSIPASSTSNKLVVQVHIPGVSDKGTANRYLAGAGLKYSTDSWSSSTTLGASEYILAPGGYDDNAGQVRESVVYQTYTSVPTASAFRIRTFLKAQGDIEIFSSGASEGGEASIIVMLIQG